MKEVQLSKRGKTNKKSQVSDKWLDYINQWNWSYKEAGGIDRGYALRRENGETIYLHRLLWELENEGAVPAGYVIDHRDGNPLNNQSDNLRLATRSQNLANRPPKKNKKYSPFKGVTYHAHSGRWKAVLTIDGVPTEWYFDSEIEAARKFNEEAFKAFGEFAWLNEIPIDEPGEAA